ncbi:MAG: anti-sigma factor family protein [Rhizobacter sp.]
MTCREFADFIGEYLSGELSPQTRAAFEQHLRLCVNCERYLTGYQESVRLGKLAFEDGDAAATDAAVPQDLLDAILAARRRS